MATRLIQLQDGTLIEAEVAPDQAAPIAGDLAQKVGTTVDAIRPLLVKICRPIVDSWQELNQEMNIDQAEVELGLSFEGEGNLYVTKAKAGANLTVKLVLKPKG
jgi:hypothetical protein